MSKSKKTRKRESVKLDQILKLLFDVSKEMLVNTLNGLFGENYDPKDVEVKITKDNGEFVLDNLDIIKADTFWKLENKAKQAYYHTEYQLGTDGSMVLRTFMYDVQKALEHSKN